MEQAKAFLTAGHRKAAMELLDRHGFEGDLDQAEWEDEQLVAALELLTPWAGDVYRQIAYLHGITFEWITERLNDEKSLSVLLEMFLDSIEDWMVSANPGERSVLVSLIAEINRRLLEHWGIGSRAAVCVWLLCDPDQDAVSHALESWTVGRFGTDDIRNSCVQATALGLDPLLVLLSFADYVGAEKCVPDWLVIDADVPDFADIFPISEHEIREHLTLAECDLLREMLLEILR